MKVCIALVLGCVVLLLTVPARSSPVPNSSTHPKHQKVKKHKAVKHTS